MSREFLNNVKRSAEKRNIPFFLTIEELDAIIEEQNFKCVYTGREIDAKAGRRYTASLDRISSDGPYAADNVQFVTKEVNFSKWKLTEQEFLSLVEDVWTHKASDDQKLV